MLFMPMLSNHNALTIVLLIKYAVLKQKIVRHSLNMMILNVLTAQYTIMLRINVEALKIIFVLHISL